MAFEKDYIAFKSAVFGGASGDVFIAVYGQDLSAAAFKWVFANPADLSPEIILAAASAGSQGISASYDAAAVHPVSGAVVGKTTIVPQINEATLEGLGFVGVADKVLTHTLYETPSGGSKRVRCFGTLTVKQGAPDL